MINENPKTTGEMMAAIVGNIGNLVRDEADLARAEIGESAKKVAASVAAMGVALVLAITGLNFVAATLVALAVQVGLPPQWAPAVVGAVFLAVALIIFVTAKSSLQHIGFVPTRAARNVQRDAAAIKEPFHDR